jgi:hypothetical protein
VSVLLRQPHGFKGLRVIPEELLAEDLALANRVDAGHLHVRVRTAAHTTPDESHSDSVADIDGMLDQLQLIGVAGVALSLLLPHNRIPTYRRSRLRPVRRSSHDDIRVIQLTNGIHVPRVPRLEERPHNLHVLS